MKPNARMYAAVATGALMMLAACSSDTSSKETPDIPISGVSVTEAWVASSESGMSASYGLIANETDEDITITSVTSDASPVMELHETVENDQGQMVMREVPGGFTIAANDSLLLEPGGNHFMLMDVTTPISAGDDVTFTMTLQDGTTVEFIAPARDHDMDHEPYEGGHGDHGDHDQYEHDAEHDGH